MNLAVIAAFTAAAVSVLNLVVTAKLTSGSQFRQWQREEARPVTARLLTLSREARVAWLRTWDAREELASLSKDAPHERYEELQLAEHDHRAAGSAAFDKLVFEVSQLDLIASPQTRDAATDLAGAHGGMIAVLAGDSPASAEDQLRSFISLEQELIDRFRADLGVPPERNWLRRLH